MDPPTLREIELETLLRERNAQLTQLTGEVTHLRQYLATQSGPSDTDPVSLPSALLTLLQPHIKGTSAVDAHGSASGSSTVAIALTQRARLLQEENDELYDLLRLGETGRLKEEVRCLRRVVCRLERALTDSHGVISSLSTELDKSYDAFLARQNASRESYTNSHSPPHMYPNRSPQMNPSSNTQNLKPIPTGPRAYKKPRLSESHTSPAQSTTSLPTVNSHPQGPTAPRNTRRDRSPRPAKDSRKAPFKVSRMEVDEDTRARSRSPRERSRTIDEDRARGRDRERERAREHSRERTRERESERERNKEKGKESGGRKRERERDRSRRNGVPGGGGGGGGSGGGGRRGHRGNASHGNGGDRTLAERMGLKKHA